MIQSELEMEKHLVEQLIGAGYEQLEVSNESHIAANFRQQLGYHNRALLGETLIKKMYFFYRTAI